MTVVPEKYDSSKPLREKIMYVLSILEKGSANEIAMEIVELEGTSSEESVADITLETNNILAKLCDEGVVEKLVEHRQKVRYVISKHMATH
jgi:hypothetical protein